MSIIYKYNKLVRDKIPSEINQSEGRNAKWRIMAEDEYLKELNRKLLEESHEFIEENDVSELADIMEVLESIMKAKNISWEDVRDKQAQKKAKKGGFEDRIFLEYVEENQRNFKQEAELNKSFRKQDGDER